MQSPVDFLSYQSYATGWRAVRFMPEKTAYRTFNALADQAWRRRGPSVRQLERNLRRVQPDASDADLRDLSRAAMRSYLRYWCDAFRLPDWSHQEIIDRTTIINEERFAQSLTGGRGMIVALGHCGNWDQLGAYGTLEHAPVASVAENLKPEKLTRKFLEYREAIGMTILTLRRGDHVFEKLVDLVNTGHIVALLADRDLTRHGVPVDFFGEPTRMPAGPAALAHATGADLVTVAIRYAGDQLVCELEAPIPVDTAADKNDEIRRVTQIIADQIATGIRKAPADWHMLQRLWLSDLDASRMQTSTYDLPQDG